MTGWNKFHDIDTDDDDYHHLRKNDGSFSFTSIQDIKNDKTNVHHNERHSSTTSTSTSTEDDDDDDDDDLRGEQSTTTSKKQQVTTDQTNQVNATHDEGTGPTATSSSSSWTITSLFSFRRWTQRQNKTRKNRRRVPRSSTSTSNSSKRRWNPCIPKGEDDIRQNVSMENDRHGQLGGGTISGSEDDREVLLSHSMGSVDMTRYRNSISRSVDEDNDDDEDEDLPKKKQEILLGSTPTTAGTETVANLDDMMPWEMFDNNDNDTTAGTDGKYFSGWKHQSTTKKVANTFSDDSGSKSNIENIDIHDEQNHHQQDKNDVVDDNHRRQAVATYSRDVGDDDDDDEEEDEVESLVLLQVNYFDDGTDESLSRDNHIDNNKNDNTTKTPPSVPAGPFRFHQGGVEEEKKEHDEDDESDMVGIEIDRDGTASIVSLSSTKATTTTAFLISPTTFLQRKRSTLDGTAVYSKYNHTSSGSSSSSTTASLKKKKELVHDNDTKNMTVDDEPCYCASTASETTTSSSTLYTLYNIF